MSHTSGYDRKITLKSAVILILVVSVTAIVIGMVIGKSFFWKLPGTVTKDEYDFKRIQGIVKDDPGNPDARVALGFRLLARGSKDEALKEFAKAYKLSPEGQATRFGLGFAYRDAGQYDKAVKILEPLVKQYPFYFLAQCNLALSYQNLKQYDKAVKSYHDALRINPGAADVYLELARIYSMTGKQDEAIKNLDQALKYVPDYQEALSLKKKLAK